METFGKWLRRQREERGWTQVDLARESGADQAAVSRLERGTRKIGGSSLETIWRLSTALGIRITEMLRVANVQSIAGLDASVIEGAYLLQRLSPGRRDALLAQIEAEAAAEEAGGGTEGGNGGRPTGT